MASAQQFEQVDADEDDIVLVEPDAAPAQRPPPEISDEEAFNQALRALLPLSPDEIRSVIKSTDKRQAAVAEPRRTVMQSRTISATLSPGGRAPTVTLAPGYTTILTVIDVTGAPWPLRASVIGDESAVVITDPGGQHNNMVTLTPRISYARTNLVLVLQDADAPLIVNIDTRGDEANDGIAMQVDRRGPHAHAVVTHHKTAAFDDDLMRSLVDGVVPVGVEIIALGGGDATAYRAGGRMFVRTQMALRWPAPLSVAYGMDRVRVYEVTPQALMVASDDEGRIHRLRISDTGLLLDNTLSARTVSPAPGSIMQPIDPDRGAYARRAPGVRAPERTRLIDGDAPRPRSTRAGNDN